MPAVWMRVRWSLPDTCQLAGHEATEWTTRVRRSVTVAVVTVHVRPALSGKLVVPAASVVKSALATMAPPMPLRTCAA